MEYLYCNKGLVTINQAGDPIVLEIGHSVVLQDGKGRRIFGEKFGEDKEYHKTFRVDEIIGNALALNTGDFHLILALNTGLREPFVVSCDGGEYRSDRVLTVDFPPNEEYNFKIDANILPPKEEEDTKALAA